MVTFRYCDLTLDISHSLLIQLQSIEISLPMFKRMKDILSAILRLLQTVRMKRCPLVENCSRRNDGSRTRESMRLLQRLNINVMSLGDVNDGRVC